MEWISVKDRLPPVGHEVIVWLPVCRDTDLDRIGKFTSEEDFKRHYSHWMPIPEPPKDQ